MKRVVWRKSRICSQARASAASPRGRRRPRPRSAPRRRAATMRPRAAARPTSSRRAPARRASRERGLDLAQLAGRAAARPRRSGPRELPLRPLRPSSPSVRRRAAGSGLEEVGADRVRGLPGRLGAAGEAAEQQSHHRGERPRRWPGRPGGPWRRRASRDRDRLAFLQFDFELLGGLRHLAGDRLRLAPAPGRRARRPAWR